MFRRKITAACGLHTRNLSRRKQKLIIRIRDVNFVITVIDFSELGMVCGRVLRQRAA
jgi:hypothetical protein